MDYTELYSNSKILSDLLATFGVVFCGGFMLTVTLHYLGYGIFKALSLLNIKF